MNQLEIALLNAGFSPSNTAETPVIDVDVWDGHEAGFEGRRYYMSRRHKHLRVCDYCYARHCSIGRSRSGNRSWKEHRLTQYR